MSLDRQRPVQTSIVSLLAVIMFVCGPAMAATFTSVQSGDWSSYSTWTPIGFPIAGDDVFIGGGNTVRVNANAACNSLTVGGGGG